MTTITQFPRIFSILTIKKKSIFAKNGRLTKEFGAKPKKLSHQREVV
jgi:hypothetical protein